MKLHSDQVVVLKINYSTKFNISKKEDLKLHQFKKVKINKKLFKHLSNK
jgi:hypothetical protein